MGFHSIILLFACVVPLTLVNADGSESLLLDHCPYNDFCTRNRTNTDDIPSGYKPCCPTCYCDSACFRYRDCCPDVNMTSLPDTEMGHPICLPAFHVTEYTESYVQRGIYQIRSCPVSYTTSSTDPDREMIKHKCEGGGQVEGLDEVLLVSNRHQHMEVFGNKYCAACNGVNEIIQWDLMIRDCSGDIKVIVDQPNIEQLPEYFLNNCYLESVPSDDLQPPERIQCWLDRQLNDTCNLHSQWNSSSPGDDIKEACEQTTHEQAFITFDEDKNLTRVYGNYKCFLCENGPDQIPSDLCAEEFTSSDDTWWSNDTTTIVLDGSRILAPESRIANQPSSWNTSSDRCIEDEVYEAMMDECIQLICPGHTALIQQQCLPIGQSMHDIEVLLKLRFFIRSRAVSTKPAAQRSGIGIDQTEVDQLAVRLEITQFNIIESRIRLFYDGDTILCVNMEYFLYTSPEHPVEEAVDIIRDLLDKDVELNLTMYGFVYRLVGNVDFMNDYSFQNSTVTKGYTFMRGWISPAPAPVLGEGLYCCQHTVYTVDRYCTLMDRLFETPCPSPVYAFEIDTKIMKGFFILSPTTFGICTDTLKRYISDRDRTSLQSGSVNPQNGTDSSDDSSGTQMSLSNGILFLIIPVIGRPNTYSLI